MSLMDSFWATPVRRRVTAITSLFALVAALSGAIKGWPIIEPLLPAQRYYVVDTVTAKIAEYKPVVDQLVRWKIEDSLSKQDEQLNALDAESAQIKSKLPAEVDVQVQAILNNRLKAIEAERAKIGDRKVQLQQRLRDAGTGPQ